MSAGDVLVAVDGLRVNGMPSNLESLLARYRVGDTVTVHAFRRDELMTFDVQLQGERVPGITLSPAVAGKQSKALPRPSAA
jgi:predicted metalloprotease with PDZ domain